MASLFQHLRRNPQGNGRSHREHKPGRKSPAAKCIRRFRMEALESRQLLSVAPALPSAWDLGPSEITTSCYVGDPGDSVGTGDVVGGSGLSDQDVSESNVNSAPVARDDAYAIRSNQQIGASVLANDSDADGDPLTAVLISGPSHGQLQFADDGLFTYLPQADFEGEDTFVYQLSDGQADSEQATVRINVALSVEANDAPSAADDNYTVAEDGVLSVEGSGVLANDADGDGDSLSAALVAPPKHGTLILGTDGSLEYTPNADYHGTDTFTYMADDGTALSQAATVTIEVTPVNDAPVAADDDYSMDEGGVLTVQPSAVLSNDADLDGDPLSASLVEGPSHGALTLNADGSFEYTPEAGYHGTDTFTYVASDGQAESNVATVTISIAEVNAAPVAADDAYSVTVGETLTATDDGVLANDADDDGDPLTAAIVEQPSNGTVVLNADGSFEYTPADGFIGDDTFTYVASDGQAESNVATVTISIAEVNAAPVAADDAYSVTAGETLTATDDGVLANDADDDGDPLTAAIVEQPSNGTVVLNADGSFEYTPADGFIGDDTFTYVASDGQAESNVATVTISIAEVNAAPVAADDAYSVTAGETLTATDDGVLANDADDDGDPLTAAIVAQPSNGTVVLNADGSFEYTPADGFIGDDTFTYVASDGQAESNVATVTISIAEVNAAPVAADDAYSVTAGETLTATDDGVLANDADDDGDPLTAAIVAQPSNGTVVLNADGSFEYTPADGFIGDDTFTYVASDGQAESNVATVTISIAEVNAAPVAADDAYSVTAGETLTATDDGVLANDADDDGDPLTAAIVAQPSNGTVVLNADGSFEYTPADGFTGDDTFTYVASDGQAESNAATVTVSVVRANAAPVAADDAYSVTAGETLTATDDGVLANDADDDGDPLTASLVEGPAHGTLDLKADGSFVYTPEAGYTGTDRFTYIATDGALESEPAEVLITVEQTTMRIHLEISGTAFGDDAGPIWGGSTFWVNAYVEDLRDLPQGVVGGAVDLLFDTLALTPTGNVSYGDAFSEFQQGTADDAAGVVDDAGALATTGGVGVGEAAAYVAWEFRRDGAGAPDDPNSSVTFSLAPGQGDGTIVPSNFALVGQGTGVDWNNVELGTAQIDLLLGDFNADRFVNHFDLALWIPENLTAAGDANYRPQFDLTADAAVNQADLDLLLSRLYDPVMPESTESDAPVSDASDDLDWVESLVLSDNADQEENVESRTTDLAFSGPDFWHGLRRSPGGPWGRR